MSCHSFRSHLLRVLKLPPEALIHSSGGFLRTTHHGLDVDFKATVQKLVYLPIIIVIISERPTETGGKNREATFVPDIT